MGPLRIHRVACGASNFHCLRLGDDIAVDVKPDGLAVSSAPDTPQMTVDHFLADQVFPRVLAQRGEFVLHAGAVHDGQSALLLLGPSGSGKSTLVASFRQAGWRLMGDDALILSAGGRQPMACAVYPSLRLFPDSIDAILDGVAASHDMAHYSSKQRLDVSPADGDHAQFPVRAMFVLDDDAPLSIRRLSVADACMAMVENSFALDPGDRERASERLRSASRLASEIPAFAISYPRQFRQLPNVRAAILSARADELAFP